MYLSWMTLAATTMTMLELKIQGLCQAPGARCSSSKCAPPTESREVHLPYSMKLATNFAMTPERKHRRHASRAPSFQADFTLAGHQFASRLFGGNKVAHNV